METTIILICLRIRICACVSSLNWPHDHNDQLLSKLLKGGRIWGYYRGLLQGILRAMIGV